MSPRWVHRLYAVVFGYFWSPCPICGQHFGGHEWRAPFVVDPVTVRGICPACVKAGRGVVKIFVKDGQGVVKTVLRRVE
jgi:hypothetical protein